MTLLDADDSRVDLLEIHDLRVEFPTRDGVVKAVDGVDFSIPRQSTVGLVGESGSGKTVTAFAIRRWSRGPARSVAAAFCSISRTAGRWIWRPSTRAAARSAPSVAKTSR